MKSHTFSSQEKEKIVQHFSAMIQCKTVSNIDSDVVNWDEFDKFQNLLFQMYPVLTSKASFQKIGKTGLLFCLAGKNSSVNSSENASANNSKNASEKTARVLMAHYDVVPAVEDAWEKPPFEGIVENDVLWGRGTIDTKGTLLSIFEALEFLLQEGWENSEDLYLAFSGDEEIIGPSCPEIVKWFQDQKIKVDFVLDEGGAIVDNVFPGVKKSAALIGIAEKGFLNLKCSIKSNGGHASTPPKHTTCGIIGKACYNVEKNPFKFQYSTATKKMIQCLSNHTTPILKIILKNLWLFMPLFKLITSLKGGEFYAITHTTQAITKLSGSEAYNVLAENASMGINLRLLGNDTIEKAMKHIKKAINNPEIELKIVSGSEPAICSDTNCKQWDLLSEVITETWPEVIVSPYLMLGCTDSRNFCSLTDKVYRFSAMYLTKEERNLVHSHNERIPLCRIYETINFYINLLKKM